MFINLLLYLHENKLWIRLWITLCVAYNVIPYWSLQLRNIMESLGDLLIRKVMNCKLLIYKRTVPGVWQEISSG